jgi:RNA polymerase sigma factor (sigma-70 family)
MNAQHIKQLNDEDLMELFQEGHEVAYDLLFERYKKRIYHFLFRYTRNEYDSEDLVQETFMRVFRSKSSYNRIAKFSTWLYTIALNLAKTQYKKKLKMDTVSFQNDDGNQTFEVSDMIDDHELEPDHMYQRRTTVRYIENALSKTSADFREVLILRDIQGLSYEEISEVTGFPMGTVKSKLNRGRVQLQMLLRRMTADPYTADQQTRFVLS